MEDDGEGKRDLYFYEVLLHKVDLGLAHEFYNNIPHTILSL
jgi:hypothetical protein